MRLLPLILSLSFIMMVTVSCYATKPSKGKQISDCMSKGTPEECDRQVNRRSKSY